MPQVNPRLYQFVNQYRKGQSNPYQNAHIIDCFMENLSIPKA